MKTKLIKVCRNADKAGLTKKFTVLNAYVRKEGSKINYLSFFLKKLDREEQIKSKVSRRKEIIKNRAQINKIENRKLTEKINKTKSSFFEIINDINKPLTRLRRKQKGHKLLTLETKEGTSIQIPYTFKG